MNGNPWYRVLTPRPNARQRLIVAPHAGGGPAYYREWPKLLPDTVELTVIQLPGRGTRWKETPFNRMEPLIASLEQQLRPLLDRPTFLFGHSLGALIAFELARFWTERRMEIGGLIVSGAAAPQVPRTKKRLAKLSDNDLRAELRQLGGTPAEVENNDELFQLFVPTLRADLEVLESYRYELNCRLKFPLLICGGTFDGWASATELTQWGRVAESVHAIRMFPGGHFYFADHRTSLVQTISSFIEQPFVREPVSEIPSPDRNAVDLFHWNLDYDWRPADKLVASVSADEIDRGNRLIKREHQHRFLVGRARLRSILCRYAGVNRSVAQSKFPVTPLGKPYIDSASNTSDLRFNISHSEAEALLAISCGHDVGCDLERHRTAMATTDMARRYFSAREVAKLESWPEAQRSRRFFDFWSAKESYIKARGLGLQIPLDEFDILLDGGPGPFVVTDRHTPSESGRWQVYPLNMADGFSAAFCTDQSIDHFRLFQWSEVQNVGFTGPAAAKNQNVCEDLSVERLDIQ